MEFFVLLLTIVLVLLIVNTHCSTTDNHTNNDPSYITVYGKVTFGTPQVIKKTSSYEECRNLCISRPFCVLAYGDKYCQLYDYGNVTTVDQMNSTSRGPEDIVTFRVNPKLDTCPVEAVNPPTFNNYPTTGYMNSNNTIYFYRFSLKNGVWSYEIKNQRTDTVCKEGWTVFQRKYGIVCLRVFKMEPSTRCSNYYNISTESGMESVDELETMKSSVFNYTVVYLYAGILEPIQSTGDYGGVMIGEFLTKPAIIPWLGGYPRKDEYCVAASHVNGTLGLITFQCRSLNYNFGMYCVYEP